MSKGDKTVAKEKNGCSLRLLLKEKGVTPCGFTKGKKWLLLAGFTKEKSGYSLRVLLKEKVVTPCGFY